MRKERLPFECFWQELVKAQTIEEINDPQFFEAKVPVRFDYVKDVKGYVNRIRNLQSSEIKKAIKIVVDLPIKNGDRIYIENASYDVFSVEWVVEERFKQIVKRYPKAYKKYAFQLLELV